MKMKINHMDLDGSGGGQFGRSVAQLIANGAGIDALRTNDSLRKEEWKALDTAVVDAAMRRVRLVAMLRSRGLVYNLANALGTTILESETASDMNPAEVNMSGKAKVDNDAENFEIGGLPIPIVSKAFEINARKLAASRKLGQPLDVTGPAKATVKVIEAIEQMTMAGTGGLAYGGYTIYGLENHPSVLTGSLTAAWTADSARAAITDVINMKQALINQRMFGPYGLIIPTAYETALDEDYVSTTSTTITIRERLLKIEGIDFVQVNDFATAGKVTLFRLVPETVRMVVGQDPAPVEWSSGDKMTMYFKVMSIMVPQVRADQDGRCGVAVFSA